MGSWFCGWLPASTRTHCSSMPERLWQTICSIWSGTCWSRQGQPERRYPCPRPTPDSNPCPSPCPCPCPTCLLWCARWSPWEELTGSVLVPSKDKTSQHCQLSPNAPVGHAGEIDAPALTGQMFSPTQKLSAQPFLAKYCWWLQGLRNISSNRFRQARKRCWKISMRQCIWGQCHKSNGIDGVSRRSEGKWRCTSQLVVVDHESVPRSFSSASFGLARSLWCP